MINEDKRATMAHITLLKLMELHPEFSLTTLVNGAVAMTDALLQKLVDTTEKAEARARLDHGIF